MKKSDIALIIGVIVVIIAGVFLMGNSNKELDYELPLDLEGEVGLHKLSYSEYQEKIDNKETFVVIIERTSCSHCQNFMPVAEEFASSNNVPMYYIDTDEMEEDDWNKLATSNTFFKKNNDSWGTPTTIALYGSDALSYIEGETTSDKLLDMYKKYFKINKKDSE